MPKKGFKHSDEAKAKMSEAQKGKTRPRSPAWIAAVQRFRGRQHTPESKEKMRLARLQRAPISEETRAKMREAHKGKTHSAETKEKLKHARQFHPPLSEEIKAKMSKALKGIPTRPHSEATKKLLRTARLKALAAKTFECLVALDTKTK